MTREAGFTLLETLVVLVVLATLVLGLAEGTRAGFSTWSAEARWSRDRDDRDAIARVLRGLIEGMDPGDGIASPLPIEGSADRLSFTADLPVLPTGVKTREADVTLIRDGNTLALRWTPHVAAPLHPPAPRLETLARDVASLNFAYWHDGAWSDQAGESMPALVRVRIVRTADAGPPMPDIVAAPSRAPPP